MAADDAQADQFPQPAEPSTSELIDQLGRFQGAPQEFLASLLAVQCRVGGAVAGAILRADAEGRLDVLAVYPVLNQEATAPSWLAQAAESARDIVAGGATAIRPVHGTQDLYGQPAQTHLILIPLPGRQQQLRGLAVFLVDSSDPADLATSREKLELTVSLLGLYEMRLTLQRRAADMELLRSAMEVLATVNNQQRFHGLAMGLVNELTSRWQCERVGVGFLKGRYVHLGALSHTEKFSRKMKIVQDLEATMEECLDQDIEIVYPAPPTTTFVNRCASELSKRHGPTCVLSLPLRHAGRAEAVLTLERPSESPFTQEEAQSLRLTADLCTARLRDLHERDRWVGARMAGATRKGLGWVVGSKHTWAKLIAMAVLGFAAFLTFAKGDYEAEGTFVLEAVPRRVLSSPFTGRLAEINAEPGTIVVANVTILAQLKTDTLERELVDARAKHQQHEVERSSFLAAGNFARAKEAATQMVQVQTRIDELTEELKLATIMSPIDGVVISGDLKRRIGVGGPVERGEELFVIAPLTDFRADLFVPEDQIADVQEDQTGQLAFASDPGRRINFRVETIHPAAQTVENQNVFKVPLELTETFPSMRPGMKGVGRIHIGRKPYGVLWTRGLVNWVRMRLWW